MSLEKPLCLMSLANLTFLFQGIQKTCKEKGWFNDVDGLMGYFTRRSDSRDSSDKPFCSVNRPGREPETQECFGHMAAHDVPIIETTESCEGLSLPGQATNRRGSQVANGRSLSQVKSKEYEASWTSGPCPEFARPTKVSLTKVGSIPIEDGFGAFGGEILPEVCLRFSGNDAAAQVDQEMNHIHLLEQRSGLSNVLSRFEV